MRARAGERGEKGRIKRAWHISRKFLCRPQVCTCYQLKKQQQMIQENFPNDAQSTVSTDIYANISDRAYRNSLFGTNHKHNIGGEDFSMFSL